MTRSYYNCDSPQASIICGSRFATGPHTSAWGSLETACGTINGIHPADQRQATDANGVEIDLSGFLIMPGLINAHDHLQYGLHPRLGNRFYDNYLDWGGDIHATQAAVLDRYNAVPRDTRIWWGGIRNLLSGVTTVCHHDRLWPCLNDETYPLNVMRNFGWAHSLAHGGDIQKLLSRTPLEAPFIMHVCEGVDELAKHEIFELDRLSALNPRSVIVHGVALDSAGVALMCDRQASLILCMSSNYFLFGRIPDISLLQKIGKLAIGNDSPLTAVGDLLDEIRFAIEYGSITAESAYAMVTEASAALLRLRSGQGTIRLSAPADLIAVRDTGDPPAIRLGNLTWKDVEFVMVAGQVRLASDDVRNRLQPYLQRGLERLVIEGELRWVRAPIDALLQEAEEVLGKGNLHLAGRRITSSSSCDTISLAGWNA